MTASHNTFIIVIALLLCLFSTPTAAQYNEGSPQYEQSLSQESDSLLHHLETHRDVSDETKEYLQYRISYPTEDYSISILINPCGANNTHGREDESVLGYDCCIDRFGQGEYAFQLGTRNRFSNGYSNGIPLSRDEPLHNIDLVDEFGESLDFKYSRRADDIVYIDEVCTGLREPHKACISDRFAAATSSFFPPCWDHNETVDASLNCFTTTGKRQRTCMQVAYSQNAYIHVCGGDFANDDQCGTFLEIHKANGTPYYDEDTVLSDIKIVTPVTNGMHTTTLPLTYKGDLKRILCSYEETTIQVGSMVQVTSNAPSCCCPQLLSPNRDSKLGAFFCPKRKGTRHGPFAPSFLTLEEKFADESTQQSFPWCLPPDKPENDSILCTQERAFAEDIPLFEPARYISRPCMPLIKEDNAYSSDDLTGSYSSLCPLGSAFEGCGMAPSTPTESCNGKDHRFTFQDEIGKVVHIPSTQYDKYGITFNDGRSMYWFAKDELRLLKPHGNYEVWFVQRNRFEKIVQKKKVFKVVWPRCTFDSVNSRYFPYAQLNDSGVPMAAI
jgi:hypothetical protein